jgi:hypothetical protein
VLAVLERGVLIHSGSRSLAGKRVLVAVAREVVVLAHDARADAQAVGRGPLDRLELHVGGARGARGRRWRRAARGGRQVRRGPPDAVDVLWEHGRRHQARVVAVAVMRVRQARVVVSVSVSERMGVGMGMGGGVALVYAVRGRVGVHDAAVVARRRRIFVVRGCRGWPGIKRSGRHVHLHLGRREHAMRRLRVHHVVEVVGVVTEMRMSVGHADVVLVVADQDHFWPWDVPVGCREREVEGEAR